jgi:RecB family endonuclease NucS
MKVTTWVKRRQSDVQAVTQVKRLSLVTRLEPEADRVEHLEGTSRQPPMAMVVGDSGGV